MERYIETNLFQFLEQAHNLSDIASYDAIHVGKQSYRFIWASLRENLSSGFPDKARFKSVSSATETS